MGALCMQRWKHCSALRGLGSRCRVQRCIPRRFAITVKHIVDAGIIRVVYIEPYPKSLSQDLHEDSITLTANSSDRVIKYVFHHLGCLLHDALLIYSKYRITLIIISNVRKNDHDTVDWERRLRISCPLKKEHLLDTLQFYTQRLN